MAHERIVIGLMSGTSADGVDAVACRIAGRGLRMRPVFLAHMYRAYPRDLRAEVLAAGTGQARPPEAFVRLDVRIGALFAEAALGAIRRAGLRRSDVALTGSHGQTICHLPPARFGNAARHVAGTWQIGQPAVIAARLGVPVVAHFREADMAVGGQGAPLVPWTDYVLLRDARRSRAIQNIGGIANVTYLPAGVGPHDVRAFDTGPGNMVIDGLAAALTGGRLRYDAGGRMARRGRVCEALLGEWLNHDYFALRPPKSCGRAQFGEAFWADGLRRYHRRLSAEDMLATATMLTARTIADAYGRWLRTGESGKQRRGGIDEIVLCGGGAKNRTLRRMLSEELPRVCLRGIDKFGIGVQAKEGLSFAMLACACVDGVAANLPAVTGASRAVVLGQITPAL